MKHGPSAGHRGEIVLRARLEQGVLVVVLSNPGAFTGPREGGSGLPIIEKRLALAYPDGASVEMKKDGARTVATIRLPQLKESGR
jgi:two-component system, LytTR family, sensor histidine kinase AlgZ